MKQRPSSLFKYRPINLYTLESIRDNYLYFNEASMFNDPFDCMLNIYYDGGGKDFDSYFTRMGLDNIPDKNQMKEALKNYGSRCSLAFRNKTLVNQRILSLSSKNDEILLWSHYADEHKGICLEYETLEMYDDNKSIHGIYFDPLQVNYRNETLATNNLLFASKVNYDDKLPKKHNLLTGDQSEFIKKLEDFIFTKYSKWNYEEEWRIFLHKENISSNNCVKLAPSILKGIIFGMRTTKRDIINVQTFLSQNQNTSNVKISKTIPQPNSYAINIKKYDSFSKLLEDD
jgi:hypothetical protein